MKSTDDVVNENSDAQRWYTGYLTFDENDDKHRALLAILSDLSSFDVSQRAIEVEYKGRDSSRFIVKKLREIAPLVGDTRGEVAYQIHGDGEESAFEFYQISDGRLRLQTARQ
jgi:hypothetical protein